MLNIPSDITFVLIGLTANHFPFVELQLGANALPKRVDLIGLQLSLIVDYVLFYFQDPG